MKRLLFVVAVEGLAIVVLLVIALDVRLHHKFEMLGGLNIKGYRGHVMPAKRPDELRIAVVGGSFAFGWGVAAPETFSGYLGRLVTESLRTRNRPPTRATDGNLAGQGIAVEDYRTRIRHFSYLAPDVICLVPDRFDANVTPAAGMPERSGVFALTGYMPILPVILEEKGRLLQATGRAPLALAGGVLLATGQMWDAVDSNLLGWVTETAPSRSPYREAVAEAVAAALESARDVVVVMPPRRGGASARGADDVPASVAGNPRVHLLDLEAFAGPDAGRLWLNDVNLGAGGNSRAAAEVVPVVLDLTSH